jgi:threonine dehydrogenase-like Zn-dependent dehydrogenase
LHLLQRPVAVQAARSDRRPGRVFDRTIGLEEVPDGYRAMNDREALKIMLKP